jgi:hypothetical protein
MINTQPLILGLDKFLYLRKATNGYEENIKESVC